jgi:hypothetical protein
MLLLRPHDAALRRFHLLAQRHVHLLAAVLAGVEQMQVHQRSVARAPVQLHVALARKRRTPQRHVLVVGLERLCAAQQEDFAGRIVLVFGTGPVVVHFVVIKGDEPGGRRMRGLQIGIALVLGVAATVVIQGVGLRPDMIAQVGERLSVHPAPARLAFTLVDVVTVVEHEIQWLPGDPPPRGVMAFLVVLAPRHRKAHPIHCGRGRRQGAGTAHRAGVATHREAVPVGATGRQPFQLHMHGVAQLGMGHRRTLAYHLAHAIVRSQLPLDHHRPRRHAAAEHQRFGR